MNRDKIEETFNKLVADGAEGFTLDLEGNQHTPEKGFAVAWHTYTTLEEAIDNVGPHQYIGYWVKPETRETFIEVVDIFDSVFNAFVNGLQRKQMAIYDFAKDECIDLSSFYETASPASQADSDVA